MGLVTEESFEYKLPGYVTDPDWSEEEKRQYGLDECEKHADIEAIELHDRCFVCGKPLWVPYVFWRGSDGNTEGEAKVISMHEGCARSLGKKITRDADKILSMNLF